MFWIYTDNAIDEVAQLRAQEISHAILIEQKVGL